jgi:hypothetical protein
MGAVGVGNRRDRAAGGGDDQRDRCDDQRRRRAVHATEPRDLLVAVTSDVPAATPDAQYRPGLE